MPQVGKMKFPYTPEGKKAARMATKVTKGIAPTGPAKGLAKKVVKGVAAKPKLSQGAAMAKGIERAMDKFRK